jgi:hypothetical protein
MTFTADFMTTPTAYISALDAERRTATGSDPVLTALRTLAAQRVVTDQHIRAVLAYARIAVRPRPYRLADLADALGMSISGTRTAYGPSDIRTVTDALTPEETP